MNTKKYLSTLFKDPITLLQQKYHLNAVVVFGSYGRGTPHKYSDIDVLIIADFKELHYIKRRLDVVRLMPLESIDLFCYTPLEFTRLFHSYNLTAIDSVEDGLILYGLDFFKPFKQELEEFYRKGMYKTEYALIPPKES